MLWRYLLVTAIPGAVVALDNGAAITPPMGYNSYMSGGMGGGDGLMAIAEFFVTSGLKYSGYEYVNSDEGWEQRTRDPVTGKIVPSKSFGNMKAYADKLHSMGLKLGLYGAASGVTCGNDPGQLYFEDIDAETYAEWGLDYLKSDNCASYALDSSVRFGAMRDALNRTGKSIVLSIEPFSINPDPEMSVKVSNLWRVACDIKAEYLSVLDRADTSDKWAPLAGPGGWNDPDMINLRVKDTLGQIRTYFGLWSIMKAPLLLSAPLPKLPKEIIEIVNNTAVILVNQDRLGVQARKLWIDGEPLPWLTGFAPCDSRPERTYTRSFSDASSADPRLWTVQPVNSEETSDFSIVNAGTGRCLTAGENTSSFPSPVTILPCDGSKSQRWRFDKGIHTVTSVTSVSTGLALAAGNDTLFSKQYHSDAFPVPAAAYGEAALVLVPPYDQANCTSRNCQNYDQTQMWFYSATDRLFRQATYTASINHRDQGTGYSLTDKMPTYQHHCLSHVLSNANLPTKSGTAEVWGGPLASSSSTPDFVIALLNRGAEETTIKAAFTMLEYPGVDESTTFTVTNLWTGASLGKKSGGFSATVPGQDIIIYRLTTA